MGRSRFKVNGVKKHRSYDPSEVAEIVDVSVGTVRGWIRNGLPAITDQVPYLILGEDLMNYLAARRAPRRTLKEDEFFCVHCKDAQVPAGGMVEFIPITPTSGNLKAICPCCDGFMYRRAGVARIPELEQLFDLSLPQGLRHIVECPGP